MSFKKWIENFDESFHSYIWNHAKKEGLEIDKKSKKILYPNHLRGESLNLYIAYKNQEVNRI